jgi:hypothetical protein
MTTIALFDRLRTSEDVDDLWGFYRTAFEPLRVLAVQEHMMSRSAFEEVLADKRVQKWVTYQDDGTPLALAVITNDLEAWPLISPPYFEHRWPEQYAAGHIWYTGFVAVAEGAPPMTFAALINKMAEQIVAVRGVCAMDYAKVNVDRNLPAGAHRAIRRRFPDEVYDFLDTQSFYAYYPAGRPG